MKVIAGHISHLPPWPPGERIEVTACPLPPATSWDTAALLFHAARQETTDVCGKGGEEGVCGAEACVCVCV